MRFLLPTLRFFPISIKIVVCVFNINSFLLISVLFSFSRFTMLWADLVGLCFIQRTAFRDWPISRPNFKLFFTHFIPTFLFLCFQKHIFMFKMKLNPQLEQKIKKIKQAIRNWKIKSINFLHNQFIWFIPQCTRCNLTIHMYIIISCYAFYTHNI